MHHTPTATRRVALALAATTLSLGLAPVASTQDPGLAGERVTPDAIRNAVVESMATVLERERTWVHSTEVHRVWNGQDGAWYLAPETARTPIYSGNRAAINKWGDPRLGLGFPAATDLEGVYVAAHAGSPTPALVAVGYRDGIEVARSDRFVLAPQHAWLALDFSGIDRVVFEAELRDGDRSFFAIDDLTFRPHGQTDVEPTVIGFDDLRARTELTGTGYQGLTWEVGSGLRDFDPPGAIHEPKAPAGSDEAIGLESGPSFGAQASTASPINVWQAIAGPRQGDPGANLIPPDTCGAVGPDHFVAITNSNLSVYRRSDSVRTVNVSLGAFWNFGQLIGDPRAAWDHHSGRWFVLATSFNRTAELFLAVSQSSDPNGNWFKFQFRTDQGTDSGTWPDFPTFGFDARGIYTSTYQVGGGRQTIFAIDKAPLLTSTPGVGTITAFRRLPYEGAQQPCATYGDPGVEYIVSRRSSSSLRIRRINPPLTAPTLSEHRVVNVPTHGRAPNAPALGSSTPLATIDSRLWNAVFRHGSVWTTHTVAVGGKSGARWYELDVNSGNANQVGDIGDPVWYYHFPSIAVDAAGDVCIGMSGSHAGAYGTTFVTGRTASDPAGTTRPPVLTKAGSGPWNRTDGAGRNRYGDYSLTSADPIDATGFWTIQEFIPANNNWQTWIVRTGFEVCNYGTALAGTAGEPTIDGGNLPTLGNVFDLQIGSSAPTASSAALLLGVNTANIPLFGGTILVQSIITETISVHAAGTTTNVPIPVPNDASAVGTTVLFQAAIADPGAPQGVAFTDGLEVRPRTR